MTPEPPTPAQPPEPPRPETPEETRARLSPYNYPGGSISGPPEPPSSIPAFEAEPVRVAQIDHGAPRPKRRARKAKSTTDAASLAMRTLPGPRRSGVRPVSVIVIVIASFMVISLVATGLVSVFNLATPKSSRSSSSSQDSSIGKIVPGWDNYPGDAYTDSSDVQADLSLEAASAAAEALVTEYRAKLTADYGLTWTQNYSGSTDRASNGYGGDSMLYNYYTPEWQGTVVLNDPSARAKIRDTFVALAKKHNASNVRLSNDLYDDDAATSKRRFGAADLDKQLLWTNYASGVISRDSTLTSDVLDTNLTRDPTFNGDLYFKLSGIPENSLVVTVSVSLYDLLSDADRAEFTKRLSTFDEANKPDGL